MQRKFLYKGLSALAAAVLLTWLFCLPRDLFRGTAYSTVVTDRNGELLGARTASDGQWRFPPGSKVPEKFATALINFEDRNFRHHIGVDPSAVARAMRQNLKSGKVVSGASTITMQVIRLARQKDRNIWQKAVEAFMATRLEARDSKEEILELYCAHAPFGGNVVGLEAASWRYFGRSAEELSWAEAACLAVLPNSPSLIHPGRNREILLSKRNSLLQRLQQKGIISEDDLALACLEELPPAPMELPSFAPHIVDYHYLNNPGKRIRTDIDLTLQKRMESLLSDWQRELSARGIGDLAAVVLDIESGQPIAYVGNAAPERRRKGADVDIARSPRSTGSILKPFLYEACLEEGFILPNTLLPDIPTNINGFAPQNFDRRFQGAVPASEALARSLNIPSVHLLRSYGVGRFQRRLTELGMSTLDRTADDYGLSLILGGAEGCLLEICTMYRDLALRSQEWPAWYTIEALKEVNRPDEIDLRMVRSISGTAWKTGTSYGFRDAWAVGVNPSFAVGVWAGNASGEGVPGLVGARSAGPVMFDIFNILPKARGWFEKPLPESGVQVEVCRESGYPASDLCPERDTLTVPAGCLDCGACPYHKLVDGQTRLVLPPSMEHWYRFNHPEYRQSQRTDPMEFIYPVNGSTLVIPQNASFRLAHSDPHAQVFWHLDGEYLANTETIHEISVSGAELAKGKHILSCMDNLGRSIAVSFYTE